MEPHEKARASYLALKRAVTDNRLLDYWWLIEQEVNSWDYWVDLPLRDRLWLWRHGFTSPYGMLYDFDAYGPEAYLSELQRLRLYKSLNGRHRYLIDDKLSQHWMLHEYPENRPDAYGFVDRGLVHGIAGTAFDGEPVPVAEWLPSMLREHSSLVMKKLRGKGGKEVVVADFDDGFFVDGEPVTEAELCDQIERLSGYLVTDYVDQHQYADDLYPRASNTIRLLTLWDDTAGELLVPAAVHRIGTEQSKPVDNWSSGGVAAEIDIDTGELSRAAQLPFSGEVEWYSRHPDTGAQIEGARVPNWEEVLSTVERLARENTNIPALGWDILLNEDGEPVVLEANTGTSIRTFQVHRPILTEPRVARLVSRHLPEVDEPRNGRVGVPSDESDPEERAPSVIGGASE